jgi:hypothetical protein
LPIDGLADGAAATALSVDVAAIVTTTLARRRSVTFAASSRTACAAAATSSTLAVLTAGGVDGAIVVAGDGATVVAHRGAGLVVHLVAVARLAIIDVAIAAGEKSRSRDDRAAQDVHIDGEAGGEFPIGAVDVEVERVAAGEDGEADQAIGAGETHRRLADPVGGVGRTFHTKCHTTHREYIFVSVVDHLAVIDTLGNRDLRRGAEGLDGDVQLLTRRGCQHEAGGHRSAGRGVAEVAVTASVEDHLGLPQVDANNGAIAQLKQDVAGAAVLRAVGRVFTQLRLADVVPTAAAAISGAAGAGFAATASAVAAGRRLGALVSVELAGVAGKIAADEAKSEAHAGVAVQVGTVTGLTRVDLSIAAAGTAVPGASGAGLPRIAGAVATGRRGNAAGGVEFASGAGERTTPASALHRSAGLTVEVGSVAVLADVDVSVAAGGAGAAVLRAARAGFPTRADSIAAAGTAVPGASGAGLSVVADRVATGGRDAARGGIEGAGDGIAAQRAGVTRQKRTAGLEVEVGPGAELAGEPGGVGIALFAGGVGQEAVSADAAVLRPHRLYRRSGRVEVVARDGVDRTFLLAAGSVDRAVVGQVVEVIHRRTGRTIPVEELVVRTAQGRSTAGDHIKLAVDRSSSNLPASTAGYRHGITRSKIHFREQQSRGIPDVDVTIIAGGHTTSTLRSKEIGNERAVGSSQAISVDVALLDLSRARVVVQDLPSTEAARRADKSTVVEAWGLDRPREPVEGPVYTTVD